MKILFAIRGLIEREGGAAYVVASLSSKMALMGHQIDILVDELDYLCPEGIGNIYVRDELGKNGLIELIRQYDIVHDNGVWLPFNHAVAVACRKTGVRRIVSPHGAMMPWIMEQRRWKKLLGWWLYQKRDLDTADLVLSTAKVETVALRKVGFTGNVIEIPLAVNPPGPTQARPSKSLRQALFLSRIHPKKGIQDLVAAWKEISPPNWRLAIVGPDEMGLRVGLEKMCDGLDVVWHGPLFGEDKVRVFQNSDLFVLPTYSENFGISVVEAMLMELPIVTTAETPWAEIENMGIGWIVHPGKEGLKVRLGEVLALQDDKLRSVGVRARQWAESQFSWPAIIGKQVEIYRNVLNSNSVKSF